MDQARVGNQLRPPIVFAFTCPDCGMRIEQHTEAHQHDNGEWVYTQDLRRFFQFRRWVKAMDTWPGTGVL